MSGDNEEASFTKVYYYMDGDTPFVSVVPVPASKITLGDFKKVFNRTNFKYFCKEFDATINAEANVELLSDRQRLKASAKGCIQLVLAPLSDAPDKGFSETLPRSSTKGYGSNSDGRINKQGSVNALSSITNGSDKGRHRVSLATGFSSNTGTMFSHRAGEQMAEFSSSSEQEPSDEEDGPQESSSMNSSCYRPRGAPNTKRSKMPKAFIPSSVGSSYSTSSHSDAVPRLNEVEIVMDNLPLGIQLVEHDGGVFIGKIAGGSAAARSGQLEVGDQIIQINKESFQKLTTDQALTRIRDVSRQRKSFKMFVVKKPQNDLQNSDCHSDPLGPLSETLPLDVLNWVQSTEPATESDIHFRDSLPINNNDFDRGSLTSDEERAAYIDRRNGVGACLVPALHNFRSNNVLENVSPMPPTVPPPVPRQDNDENEAMNAPLNVDTDPIIVLRRMVMPNSGLEITNRKWLKIPFPNSFIGNDMINWLLTNVTGFRNKKHAQAYAGTLLSKGFIRHVLDGKQFDKKRYYFFDESIIAFRRKIEYHMRQQERPTNSANTEVTYLGSPTYPAPKNNLKPSAVSCGAFPGPSSSNNFFTTQNSYLTTSRIPRAAQSQPRLPSTSARSPFYPPPHGLPMWPISPIAHCGPPERHCESPQTNDYASMIQGEINSNYMPVASVAGPPGRMGNGQVLSASPPPNTPNTLSATSSTTLVRT